MSVILATGVSRNRPQIDGLEKYEGRGVSYCVSCDGFFFRNRQVMVIGEGVYAANQALELYEYSPNVAICTGGKSSAISGEFSSRLEERGIQVIEDRIISLHGEPSLDEIVFESGKRRPMDGMFNGHGRRLIRGFRPGSWRLHPGELIQVDRDMKDKTLRASSPRATVPEDSFRSARPVGEGAIAGHSAISHVRESREKINNYTGKF